MNTSHETMAIRGADSHRMENTSAYHALPKVVLCGLITLVLMLFSEGAPAQETVSISDEIQAIKAQTLELNRDLFVLEEELLFPDNTALAVFVSLDVGDFFALDAVKLSVDGEVVTHYLYTERQVQALRKGGIHRLYQANLKTGEHEVVAVFNGKGPHGRDYRRATKLQVDKQRGAKHIELRISDAENLHQPEFTIEEW